MPNPNYVDAPFTGVMWTPETGVVPLPPPPTNFPFDSDEYHGESDFARADNKASEEEMQSKPRKIFRY